MLELELPIRPYRWSGREGIAVVAAPEFWVRGIWMTF
jgi:hypothetical protein